MGLIRSPGLAWSLYRRARSGKGFALLHFVPALRVPAAVRANILNVSAPGECR